MRRRAWRRESQSVLELHRCNTVRATTAGAAEGCPALAMTGTVKRLKSFGLAARGLGSALDCSEW